MEHNFDTGHTTSARRSTTVDTLIVHDSTTNTCTLGRIKYKFPAMALIDHGEAIKRIYMNALDTGKYNNDYTVGECLWGADIQVSRLLKDDFPDAFPIIRSDTSILSWCVDAGKKIYYPVSGAPGVDATGVDLLDCMKQLQERTGDIVYYRHGDHGYWERRNDG